MVGFGDGHHQGDIQPGDDDKIHGSGRFNVALQQY